MAIVQITPPESTPQSVGDYQAQNNLTDSRLSNEIFPVVSGNIAKGSKFIIQGSTFIADSDTAITGSESDYVKLVVSGTTASAVYLADLTGVTWSDVYNGYYTGIGEYVFFDEMKAYINNDISNPRLLYNKIMSEITDQVLKKVSNVEFANLVAAAITGNSLTVSSLIKGASLDITGSAQTSSLETGNIDCDSVNTGNGYVECFAMDQDVQSDDDVLHRSLTLSHNLLPSTNTDEGTWSIPSSVDTPFTLPRGVFQVKFTTSSANHAIVEMFVNGSWEQIGNSEAPNDFGRGVDGMLLMSSGNNVRMYNGSSVSSNPVDVYYMKF